MERQTPIRLDDFTVRKRAGSETGAPPEGRDHSDARANYRLLRKLGKRFGIVGKEMDEAENEVYDASHENLPGGADAGVL
jgi:hypothetical protein